MPFDSQGNFSRIYSWEQDRINDIDIVSDRHDEEDDNFAAGLNNCMLRDGRCTMSGNLNMGNFQIKNVANGNSNSDAVNRSQLNSVDGNALHKSGTETASGAKTFSTSVTTPTMTATTLTATTATISGTLNIPGGRIWIA